MLTINVEYDDYKTDLEKIVKEIQMDLMLAHEMDEQTAKSAAFTAVQALVGSDSVRWHCCPISRSSD